MIATYSKKKFAHILFTNHVTVDLSNNIISHYSDNLWFSQADLSLLSLISSG